MSTILDALNKAKKERPEEQQSDAMEGLLGADVLEKRLESERKKAAGMLRRTIFAASGVIFFVCVVAGGASYLIAFHSQHDRSSTENSSVETAEAALSTRDPQPDKMSVKPTHSPPTSYTAPYSGNAESLPPPEKVLVINIVPPVKTPEVAPTPVPPSLKETVEIEERADLEIIRSNDTSDIRPQSIRTVDPSTLGFTLGGIVYDKNSPLAMIDGKIVRVGDDVGEFEVVKIERTGVHVENKEGLKYIVKY